MNTDMEMYLGDLKPDLRMSFTTKETPSSPAVPVSFTGSTSITVIGKRDGAVVFSRAGTDEGGGVVSMQWSAGDTATVGRISIDVRVLWPGSKPQTYRASGVVVVHS